jgi:hypothetical protein
MADPSTDFGNSVASSAVDTGKTAINSFNPNATATSQQNNTGNLFNTQQNQTNDYIGQYSKAVANNPTVTSLYNKGNEMFNVPQLAQQATNLNNQMTGAVPSGYAGARGFDISNTDVQNGIAQRTAYLQPQANAANANYNSAAGLASQYVTAGQAQNQQNLLPIQAEQQNLLQQQAAQATGWNNAAQSEFQALVSKMNAGVTLSQAELDRANILASQETSYLNQITASQATVNVAKIGAQFQKVDKGQNLVNTLGQTILNPSMTNTTGVQTYG